MDKKCPYCGAETRPGDNFCLNCGNRLPVATPSPVGQQAQAVGAEPTVASHDDWAAPMSNGAPAGNWSESAAPTVANTASEPDYRSEPSAATAQATMDKVEQPSRFILRAENGDIVQEYLLDKLETNIGRAPNSDILLSKDKLTSRRHAIVQYENGHYTLRDERSANGTFVNGQQIEEMAPWVLEDGDHIGIGEHELVFRAFGSPSTNVEDLPTMAVSLNSAPVQGADRIREERVEAGVPTNSDNFQTLEAVEAKEADHPQVQVPATNGTAMPSTPGVAVPSTPTSDQVANAAATPLPAPDVPETTLDHLTRLSQPSLPDVTTLMAALSTLDEQVTSLQQQLQTSQEAMRTHDSELTGTTSQLRTELRRISDRMDSTIADVARSREALAWAELLQLMEDVMNNPRDIEYVTKLARKARDLNKVFQIHQNVLNTMAECNSLLRHMIGDEK